MVIDSLYEFSNLDVLYENDTLKNLPIMTIFLIFSYDSESL